ncbi:MAG TPA: FAD-dependent monooxygenase [Acidobacteriaceae bacterium]|jgi:flavin-dependent dehydrogenase
MSNHHCDVCIIGAGPAGLAAAIALRQRGADVLLADALQPPIDKPCGEGLMPDSRSALAQLGIGLEPRHGAEFTGITFASHHARVAADFPSGRGIGVRRTTLHSLLCDRASALGVRFSWNTPIVLKEGATPTLAGEPIASRWLIGADGHASRVRTWAGLDRAHLRSRRFGFRAHYRIAPQASNSRHVEVHWGPLGQAYVTPIAADEICVSAMTRHHGVRLQEILAGIPALHDLLRNASPTTTERGSLTLTRRLRRVTRNNVALIGDASGSVDAITGEGLALGFRQALLLADALAANSLALYESRHAAILRLPQRMATLLLLLDRLPRLRNRTICAFAARPALFHELLAVHIGEQTLPAFLLRHGPKMGALLLAGHAGAPAN